jgi:hypothetical protein
MSGGLFVIKMGTPPLGINSNTNIPGEFSLFQNYPNPFNPNTTVEYNVPKNTYVTIKVFDAVGRLAALLVDEQKTAGNYKINFDAGNLASGIYYYTMNTSEFTQTKKMILIK